MDPVKPAEKAHPVLFITLGLLVVVWVFPRLLLAFLGMDNPWTSHLYLYGYGGLFFLVGIILILKTGACRFGRGYDSFWFKMLIFGYVFFVLLHTVWILAALYLPYKGEV